MANDDLDDLLADLTLDLGLDDCAALADQALLDFDFAGNPQGSEKYNSRAKIFLDENKLFLDRNRRQYQIITQVLEDLTLPAPGESWRIRTQQQINLITIVLKILMEHETIDELTIATYTLNRDIFDNLIKLLRTRKIKKLGLLLASSYTFRSPKNYEYFKLVCRETAASGLPLSLIFAWSHFKITLAQCGSDYYHFEGSMNYSVNNLAENLVFSNAEDAYRFDYDFIHTIMTDRHNAALEIIC